MSEQASKQQRQLASPGRRRECLLVARAARRGHHARRAASPGIGRGRGGGGLPVPRPVAPWKAMHGVRLKKTRARFDAAPAVASAGCFGSPACSFFLAQPAVAVTHGRES